MGQGQPPRETTLQDGSLPPPPQNATMHGGPPPLGSGDGPEPQGPVSQGAPPPQSDGGRGRPPQNAMMQGAPPPQGQPGPAARAPAKRVTFSMLSLSSWESVETRDDLNSPGDHENFHDLDDDDENRTVRPGPEVGNVDARSCAEEGGLPQAFCRRVVPAVTLWVMAWALVLSTAVVACARGPCRCCSPPTRVRARATGALLAAIAMAASVATLASSRGGIAAEMSEAAPEGLPAELEVGFGWGFGLAVFCTSAQLVFAVALMVADRWCPQREGVVNGEPMPAKGNASASSCAIVVGQPVGRSDADDCGV